MRHSPQPSQNRARKELRHSKQWLSLDRLIRRWDLNDAEELGEWIMESDLPLYEEQPILNTPRLVEKWEYETAHYRGVILKARKIAFRLKDVERAERDLGITMKRVPVRERPARESKKNAPSHKTVSIENPPYPGETPLTGWVSIAQGIGWSVRKAQTHREDMIKNEVIYYERKGKTKVTRAWPSDLKRYAKAVSQKERKT